MLQHAKGAEMTKPGCNNLITDIDGLMVGNAEDISVRTGTTVLIGEHPFAAAVDVRGAAPGTRNIDMLQLENSAQPIDAITLSGGSVYGLDAPSGVASHLAASGRGLAYETGVAPIPLVSGAILFDLSNGGDKNWGDLPPYRELGRKAAQNASRVFRLGNSGAGYGARAGVYKGGLGSASFVTDEGIAVGALAAVNAVGSPIVPGTDIFWAWPFEQGNEFGRRRLDADFRLAPDLPADIKSSPSISANTTIAIVATDAQLSHTSLKQLAVMATDGFARALRPVHTPFDGDLVFAISTGTKKLRESEANAVMRLGMLAADALTRAIARGVYEAKSLGAHRSYRETFGL